MKAATKLSDFEEMFARTRDPWDTFVDRDERIKRRAIVHALGSAKHGRILELGAGNGSNSAALAPHARRLDSCEGTLAGTALVAEALNKYRHARALRLPLPARLPGRGYEAVVIAELLYYLSDRDMRSLAREVRRATRRGARLVLAHHHLQLEGFAQLAAPVHRVFIREFGSPVACIWRFRSSRWVVEAYGVAG